jgi:hypothetical protein
MFVKFFVLDIEKNYSAFMSIIKGDITMKIKNELVYIGLVLLGACQHPADYGTHLRPWIGQTEYQLYNSWGTPNQVTPLSNTEQIVTYWRLSDAAAPSSYGREESWTNWFSHLFEPKAMYAQPQTYYCKTSFIIRNGTIINFDFNGDACVYTH